MSFDSLTNWTRLYGNATYASGLTLGDDESIYISGFTNGDFDDVHVTFGNSGSGAPDIYLINYDLDGTKNWTEIIQGGSF